MKKYFLCIIIPVVCYAFSVSAQNPNEDSIWVVNNYHKREVMIPMRDGVKLFTSILIPNNTTEKHPILMMRTPYSCAPYGEGKFRDVWNYQRMKYFREGYIMVTQDVRGRFMSEGTFEDVRPFNPNKKTPKDIDEASDTYDAIDWLVKNVPQNNGNVGVTGISYPGFYATMAAMSNHPALKAVSPQAPVTDWFMGDDMHHNGAFFLMDNFDFFRRFGIARPKPTTKYPEMPELKSDDNYSFFLNAGTIKEIKKNYLGDSIRFWNESALHPNYDSWWQERNARKYISNIKPAVLTVGGLFDAEDCYGAWQTYQTIEKRSPGTTNKIVMGPWAHNRWQLSGMDRLGNVWFGSNTSKEYFEKMEFPFFQHYLKGKGDGGKLPEATIYVTGENRWNTFDQWPPKGVSYTPLYLHENEKAGYGKPVQEKSFDEYISNPQKPVPYTEDVHRRRTREYMTDDQRFAARRPDVLVYETDVLAENVTLTGPLTADLYVSISTTDADFVVKVIDVFPDDYKYPDSAGIKYPMGGYQMLVRGEVMRGRFRNSFEKPEPFMPGKVERIKFELPDVAHTFQKGHRIMVQVQSSWFPLVDRNPQLFVDIYQCERKDFINSTIRIYHDREHPSAIVLPVLTR